MNVPRLRVLRLKRREEKRLLGGHAWVYSNEVDVEATPLKEFEAGESVEVVTSRGDFLASGYVNPHSLICARILSRDRDRPPSIELLRARLADALALRERLRDAPWYRLVHGEGDGLPGLVVDRYGDVLVAQITTAGMERLKDDVVTALRELLAPRAMLWQNSSEIRSLEGLPRYAEPAFGIARQALERAYLARVLPQHRARCEQLTQRDVWQNSSEIRSLEGLPRYAEPAFGAVPEAVELTEHAARFRVPLQRGQKTGWFYDQRDNRARLLAHVRGARVLDVCAYLGAWGVQAAVHGAREVCCLDSSAGAIAGIRENAALNGVQIEAVHADAFEGLRELRRAGRRFDAIALDPPAFIKRRKDMEEGRVAYLRLNELAVELIADGGVLASCSCSFHLSEEDLIAIVQRAGARAGRFLRLLETGGQSADHPVHPAIPETRYLKCLLLHASG